MRIAVMGAGGQGGFFGSQLIQAGHDVHLIARGKHLKAMQEKGLTVKSQTLGDITHKVQATDNPASIDPVDLILFCVKTYDLHEAANQIIPLIQKETIVLPIQNGVEAADQIGEIIGIEHVIGGLSYVSAVIEEPGTIKHYIATSMNIGELNGGISPRIRKLETVFKEAGIEATPSENIRELLWQKLAMQSGLSGVLSVTRLPFEIISRDEVTWGFMRDVMMETRSVAAAAGYDVPVEFINGMMNRFYHNWRPGTTPSMVGDLLAGKRMELEAYNGAVVRFGEIHGVETPLNYAIYAALKPHINGSPKNI